MKKLFGYLFAGALVLSAAGSIAAFAPNSAKDVKAAPSSVDPISFYIGTHNMVADSTFNEEDDPGHVQGSAVFNAGNPNVLTLTNFHYNGDGAPYHGSGWIRYGILYSLKTNLKIELIGNNSITLAESSEAPAYGTWDYNAARFYPKDAGASASEYYYCEFTGTGSFKTRAPDVSTSSYGGEFRMRLINKTATLEFESGHNYSGNCGVLLYGGSDISGGSITGKGNSYGLRFNPDGTASSDNKISGGTVTGIAGIGTASSCRGVDIGASTKYGFEMSGGTLIGQAPTNVSTSYGIYMGSCDQPTAFKGGTVNASGKYGFYAKADSDLEVYPGDVLNLSGNLDFNASGTTQALYGRVLNSIKGVGYSNVDYTGTQTGLPTVTEFVDYSSSTYKSAHFENYPSAVIDEDPVAIEGLKYTGEPLSLVSGGSVTGGSLSFSLDNVNWSEDIPTATSSGEHTVYYKALGDMTHSDSEVKSIKVTIAENDKSELVSVIAAANELYESLEDKSSAEAVALHDAIVAGQAVKDNKDASEKEISDAVKAIKDAMGAFGSDTIIDEESGTSVETKDGTLFPDTINLSVEVKADVKAEEGSAEREAIEAKLAENEAIVKVFDVKLIKNEGGVETEVQPSDIKEGMTIIISINVPEDVNVDDLKILHVHNASEMEFIEEFELADRVVKFEVSKLSELAFINKVNAPAPVDPSGSNNFREGDKALRAFVISKKDGRAKVMVMPFKFMYRDESEVFNSKEEALR